MPFDFLIKKGILYSSIIFFYILISIIYYFSSVFCASHFTACDYGLFYKSTQSLYTAAKKKSIYFVEYARSYKNKKWVQSYGVDLNPPFFHYFISPLGIFTYSVSYWIWFFISLSMGLMSSIILIQQFVKRKSFIFYLVSFLLLLHYYPIFISLRIGQLGFLSLFLTILLWKTSSLQYERLTGLLLGVAINIKLFFGLFIIFFLLQKRKRLLFSTIFFSVISNIFIIWHLGIKTFLSYYHSLNSIHWYGANWNASLLGYFTRLYPHSFIAFYLYGLVSCFLFFYTIKTLSAIPRDKLIKNKLLYALSFSLISTEMLLFSPLGWIYYFSLLIIAYYSLWYWSAYTTYPSFIRLFLFLILLGTNIPQPFIAYINASYYSIIANMYTYCLVILVFLLLKAISETYMRYTTSNLNIEASSNMFLPKNLWLVFVIPFILSTWFGIQYYFKNGVYYYQTKISKNTVIVNPLQEQIKK